MRIAGQDNMLTRNDHRPSNGGGGAPKGREINIHGVYNALEIERNLHVQDLRISYEQRNEGQEETVYHLCTDEQSYREADPQPGSEIVLGPC